MPKINDYSLDTSLEALDSLLGVNSTGETLRYGLSDLTTYFAGQILLINDGMPVSSYDPAGIEEQLVGLTAAQTISNKTFSTGNTYGFDNAGTTLIATDIDSAIVELSVEADALSGSIDTNAGDIITNADNITTNAGNITTNSNDITSLEGRVITIVETSVAYGAGRFEFVLVTTGASDKIISLPTSSLQSGDIVKVSKRDSGAGNVVVNGAGLNINNAATAEITAQYTSVTFWFTGTEWIID